MADIKIKLPDGSEKSFPDGVNGFEIAKSISSRLAKEAIAIKVNGSTVDLTRPIDGDAEVQILTWNDREGKEVFWHSSAHIMAQAVLEVFPDANYFLVDPLEENRAYLDSLQKIRPNIKVWHGALGEKACSLPFNVHGDQSSF